MFGDILAERTMLAFSSEGLQDMRKSRVRQSICQMLVWMVAACASGPPVGTSSRGQSTSGGALGINADESDASERAVSDANSEGTAGGGYCSPALGAVPATDAWATQAFWCPGLCTMGPGKLYGPELPGSDSAPPSFGPYSCTVGNGSHLVISGDP